MPLLNISSLDEILFNTIQDRFANDSYFTLIRVYKSVFDAIGEVLFVIFDDNESGFLSKYFNPVI